jgi:hypothetical protein
MLINTPHKIGDIVTLKLFSGEELVGKLTEETNTLVKIKTPLTLVMSQQGLGLQQYLFTVDPDVPLPIERSALVTITKTHDQFAKVYQERTSGLVTAPAGMDKVIKTPN